MQDYYGIFYKRISEFCIIVSLNIDVKNPQKYLNIVTITED